MENTTNISLEKQSEPIETVNISKKVCILGEGGVGKTTLMLRYITGKFNTGTKLTIGTDFFVKKLNFTGNGIETRLRLLLWDFAGEKRFRFLLNDYVKGADAIIIAFDLSRPKTLYRFADWMDVLNTVRSNKNKTAFMYLIGTKKDLYEKKGSIVDYEFVKEWMEENKIEKFVETSSKSGEMVNELFMDIAKNFIVTD